MSGISGVSTFGIRLDKEHRELRSVKWRGSSTRASVLGSFEKKSLVFSPTGFQQETKPLNVTQILHFHRASEYSTGGGGRQRAGDGEGRGWGCNYFALSNPKITRLPQLQSGPHYAALQKRGRNTRPIKTKRESRDGREDNISTAGVDLTCL